jgi:hypothetical protein
MEVLTVYTNQNCFLVKVKSIFSKHQFFRKKLIPLCQKLCKKCKMLIGLCRFLSLLINRYQKAGYQQLIFFIETQFWWTPKKVFCRDILLLIFSICPLLFRWCLYLKCKFRKNKNMFFYLIVCCTFCCCCCSFLFLPINQS